MLRSLLAAVMAAVVGCGSAGGENLAAVSGTVTFDGKPVEEGSITFRPIEGTKGPVAGESIKDGKYALPRARGVGVGKNRVEILANRKTGKKVPNAAVPGTEREEIEQYIPAKYNEKSELIKDIAAGSNEINFELTGK